MTNPTMIEPTEEGRKLAADLANAEVLNFSVVADDFKKAGFGVGKALARLATRFLAMEADMAEIADELAGWATGNGRVAKAYSLAAKYRKPKPVDPDVLVVRATLHAHQRSMTPPDSGWGDMSYLKGSYDHLPVFQEALAAYKEAKRGIELKETGE